MGFRGPALLIGIATLECVLSAPSIITLRPDTKRTLCLQNQQNLFGQDPELDDCPRSESFYDQPFFTKDYEWEVAGDNNFRLISREGNLCLGACTNLFCRGVGISVDVEKCYYQSDCRGLFCGSDAYQVWSLNGPNSLKNQETGKCLAYQDEKTLVMADCTATAEQKWAFINPRPPTTTTTTTTSTTTPPHRCQASYDEVLRKSLVCLEPLFRAYERCSRCTKDKCEKWTIAFSNTAPYRYECPADNEAFPAGADKDKFRMDGHEWGYSCDLTNRIKDCFLPRLDELVCDDPSFRQEKTQEIERSYSCDGFTGIVEQVVSFFTSGTPGNLAPTTAMIALGLWML